MLTEHEQLADHEARISRQELPPLQQPLDNIEEIKHALDDPWLPFESAPDGVDLLWCFTYEESHECVEYFANSKQWIGSLLKGYTNANLLKYFTGCFWQLLPPPPKEQK